MRNKITIPPDDPECEPGINERRSEWALIAIDKFRQATGIDEEDAVSDLIADIAHYCDRHGVQLMEEIRRAKMHYEAETALKGKQFKALTKSKQ